MYINLYRIYNRNFAIKYKIIYTKGYMIIIRGYICRKIYFVMVFMDFNKKKSKT